MRRLAVAGLLALVIMPLNVLHARAQATREDVETWVEYYAVRYSSLDYPFRRLYPDALRVAQCETGGWDERVINNVRRGRYGEVGAFQFLPGPRSIFWGTPTAALGYDYFDPEANTAAAVWLLAHGYARHWTCF